MALFVGVINAAYTILASRILFTDKYAGQALLGLLFGLVLAALAQPRQRFDNNTEE